MPKKSHRGNVRKSRRSHLSMLALEPRLMFDAAAAETAVSDLHHTEAIVQPTSMATPHAVIVVDARVEDGMALAQAIDPTAEIIRIDLSGDGLESLASQLSDHREITT